MNTPEIKTKVLPPRTVQVFSCSRCGKDVRLRRANILPDLPVCLSCRSRLYTEQKDQDIRAAIARQRKEGDKLLGAKVVRYVLKENNSEADWTELDEVVVETAAGERYSLVATGGADEHYVGVVPSEEG